MKEGKLFVLMWLMLQFSVQAQEKKIFDKELNLGNRMPVYVSYYGNMAINPGVRLGLNWNIFMIEKTIDKKRKTKKIRKLFYVSPSIMYYYNFDWQNASGGAFSNVMIRVDADWRRYTKRLYYVDIGIGAGYFLKFNSGNTIEVNDNASMAENTGATSRSYFATTLSFAFGKQISMQSGNTITPFIRLDTNYLFGYNANFLPEANLELGVMFIPKWSLKQKEMKVTGKNKSKSRDK